MAKKSTNARAKTVKTSIRQQVTRSGPAIRDYSKEKLNRSTSNKDGNEVDIQERFRLDLTSIFKKENSLTVFMI